MRSRKKQQPGKGALDIIEEVIHVLRRAPFRVVASYYVGTLPFVLGLLFFWADMSKSAYARAHLAQGAFVLALLFVWMKTWQAVYAGQVMAGVRDEPGPRWTWRRLLRLAARQTIVQPFGLLLLPLALVVVVPFGWMYALYQNLTVLDDGESTEVRELTRRAAGLARLWPRQNLFLIWALSPFLLVMAVGLYLGMLPIAAAITPDWTVLYLQFYAVVYALLVIPLSPFGVIIALNIAATVLLAPQLIKMFLGVQTVFVTNPFAMFNSTFFALVCALTFLCMDPLVKAAYVLRCFYGESLHSGVDLKVGLKRVAKPAVVLCILAAATVAAMPAATQEGDAAATRPEASTIQNPKSKIQNDLRVAPGELANALDRELQSRRYAWRMPRVLPSPEEEGLLAAWTRTITETLARWLKTLWNWIEKVLDWFGDHVLNVDMGQSARSLSAISAALRALLYLLLATLVCVLCVMLWRTWKRRGARRVDLVAEAVGVAPDLEDEDTAADDLAEEGWLALAEDLRSRGEWRLALRALFLAILASLNQRELIRIARFKSNRDYEQDLRHRAHVAPDLLDTFRRSVVTYETVWYGAHQATQEGYVNVMANLERLQASGQAQ